MPFTDTFNKNNNINITPEREYTIVIGNSNEPNRLETIEPLKPWTLKPKSSSLQPYIISNSKSNLIFILI